MRKPYLIQRCNLAEKKLIYQYMGMSEFECGEQSKSLKRIFAQGITTQKFFVTVEGHQVEIFLVAGMNFDFTEYEKFLDLLVNEEWHRPEPTHLNRAIKQRIGLEDGKNHDETNAWFDFQNDVLFVLSGTECQSMVQVLDDIKSHWENPEPDPPTLIKFKEELEAAKILLADAGKTWFSLSSIREFDGEYRVWLNPFEQHIHDYGWFTINDLHEWVKDQGIIMKTEI